MQFLLLSPWFQLYSIIVLAFKGSFQLFRVCIQSCLLHIFSIREKVNTSTLEDKIHRDLFSSIQLIILSFIEHFQRVFYMLSKLTAADFVVCGKELMYCTYENPLIATTTGTPNLLAFSICFWRFKQPSSNSSKFWNKKSNWIYTFISKISIFES